MEIEPRQVHDILPRQDIVPRRACGASPKVSAALPDGCSFTSKDARLTIGAAALFRRSVHGLRVHSFARLVCGEP